LTICIENVFEFLLEDLFFAIESSSIGDVATTVTDHAGDFCVIQICFFGNLLHYSIIKLFQLWSKESY